MRTRGFPPWIDPRATASEADDVHEAPSVAQTVALPDASRRALLKGLGAGALVIACGPAGVARVDAAAAPSAAAPWSPHVYLRIAPDGIVTITCHRSEMGQGIRTTMPMTIADELEADWSLCRVEQAGADEKYGSQNTDGSTSIRDFLDRYREAGATARALLEDAAARQWGVPAGEVAARQHRVVHAASGRSATYGSLVAIARTLPMPPPARVRIKQPAERRWQGKQMPSIDAAAMASGAARYGADVSVPGMRIAVIARPPDWGARVGAVDATAALAVPGVERVVRIPGSTLPGAFLPLGGVAVIARDTWAALRARDALRVTWERGPHAGYESKAYRATLSAALGAAGKPGRSLGDADATLAGATRTVRADYYMPHLSHAQMEPLVALAHVRKDRVELWGPTQSPVDARDTVAKYLGVPKTKVTVHVTLLGGGFGRKSKPDFFCEAAYLSRAIGAPVRVQWTREDDLRHSYYHAVAAHRLEAALDDAGRVTAWRHRSAYPSINATFAPDVTGGAPDELLNGASDVPWDVPNLSVEVCPAVAHARIGWFRSVNAIHHGYAIGSFVDELAHAAGQDPGAFLLALIGAPRTVDLRQLGLVAPPADYYGARWEDRPLETARARGVVEVALRESGWGSALPPGRGRGIAMVRSFLSYVAVVVEVEVQPDGTVLVPRATVAVDAGFVVNPDRARAQMEGAVTMALSNTLHGEITFADGAVQQRNFDDYRVVRMPGAPRVVDVHIVASEGAPGGIGEPGVPPAGGAVMNAIHAATGVRVRELPVGAQLAGWNTRAARLSATQR